MFKLLIQLLHRRIIISHKKKKKKFRRATWQLWHMPFLETFLWHRWPILLVMYHVNEQKTTSCTWESIGFNNRSCLWCIFRIRIHVSTLSHAMLPGSHFSTSPKRGWSTAPSITWSNNSKHGHYWYSLQRPPQDNIRNHSQMDTSVCT